jgi:hypothetical protein
MFIAKRVGLNCSGRGKYITSTDISPPSTGLFPAVPEYNLSPILNLLILRAMDGGPSAEGQSLEIFSPQGYISKEAEGEKNNV